MLFERGVPDGVGVVCSGRRRDGVCLHATVVLRVGYRSAGTVFVKSHGMLWMEGEELFLRIVNGEVQWGSSDVVVIEGIPLR